MSKAIKKSGYKIIVLSEKTGRELKRPVRGKSKVIYAIKGPRGGIKKLRKEAQIYYPTDFKGLSRNVEATGTQNFVAYEQKTGKLLRKNGEIQYRVDKSGVKHKLYETKITFAKSGRKQKPILYARGKAARSLDFGFKKGNYQSVAAARNLVLVKPNVQIHEQVLKGTTLKKAISNIHMDINMANVRKHGFGLYYNVFLIIHTPEGDNIKVPVSGSFRDMEFQEKKPIILHGRKEIFARNELKILANLHSEMSKAIRYALKNTGDGYTFTSLLALEQIEKRVKNDIKKADKSGDEGLAGKLASGLKGLYFGWGNKTRLFKKKESKLTLLDRRKYSVTLYVKFEMMYE